MPELAMTVGEKVKIEVGDCLCIWMGPFSFTGWLNTSGRFLGSHPWKLIDFKKGVLEEGEVTADRAWAVSGLPSDSQRGESMLGATLGA